ncbi:hypothetical protein Rfer_4397 (plasmid) [Rhodoferax ferrireducens T118]|uniref:Uncharacterized protein n=2 Tax=Rhodoferax ferrireducens TaxID=192843 RepID=Q21Q62_ALBFT|nr:hypothetical protein Rfer_4397 [Rhodoferax ferrireducens T118]
MALALAATWIAGKEIRALVSAVRTSGAQAGDAASLSKEDVPLPELTALSTMLERVTPSVSFKPEGNTLKVWVDAPVNYSDWVLALSTLQTYQKGLVWDVKVICANCEGKAAYAEVAPYVQKIVWK